MKIYKALQLYLLSTRGPEKEYKWNVNSTNNIIVQGFVINEEKQKKFVMNLLTQYSYNTNITAQVIKNSYVAWLFDDTNKKILFLSFWQTKKILEQFHKKITSWKFAKYFSKEILDTEVLNTTLDLDMNIRKTKIKSPLRKVRNDNVQPKVSLQDLKEPKNAQLFLNWISSYKINELIQNEDKFNLSLYTLESSLPQTNDKSEVKSLLKTLSSINIPRVQKLKKMALERLSLLISAGSSRRRAEAVLSQY